MVMKMNLEKRNCRIYELSHKCFDTQAIELLMRAMREEEKNIWRVDYTWLREEMKTCFFYCPELADSLLNRNKTHSKVPFRIRGGLLLGLMFRNVHWSILEEEFFHLYGSLQMPVQYLFHDYIWLRSFHALQVQGEWVIPSLESALEWIKSIETNWILSHYKPKAWQTMEEKSKIVRVERGRINWIQKVVCDGTFPLPKEMESSWGQDIEYETGRVNQWRISIDRLQRRERTGIGNSELRQCKNGETCTHACLGPLQIVNKKETPTHLEIEAKGILRTYIFRYKKKR